MIGRRSVGQRFDWSAYCTWTREGGGEEQRGGGGEYIHQESRLLEPGGIVTHPPPQGGEFGGICKRRPKNYKTSNETEKGRVQRYNLMCYSEL